VSAKPTFNRPVIRPLPERLINKIAAGEVVERPAAVIKELVENAIDAGSTRIEIHVERSGSKLIKVIDNGCGIPADQIEIAFSRHATSKISGFSDLDRIMSYGFRGEALPSIASVSRTRMVSRTSEAEVGTEIIFEGGVLQSKKPIAAPVGTTIEVENLFFNTPARRKFLKAETTEARYLSRTAMALALGRSDIAFSFTMNGRVVFNLPGGDLGQRVAGLLGYGKNMVRVGGETGPMKVEGYVGKPDQAQSNRFGHFIFVNGRYIQSMTLSHAISAGYGELLPKGLYPVGALLLTVDPTEVDVNVHPTKTEVRLSQEREIHDALVGCIRDALRQDGIIPAFRSAEPGREGAESPSLHLSNPPTPSRQEVIPGIAPRSFPSHEQLRELYRSPDSAAPQASGEVIRVDASTGEILESHAAVPAGAGQPMPESPELTGDSIRLVGRFSDLYLLLQAGEDLFIVDQHTAHERVLFEATLRKMERHEMVGQQLLLPVQVELGPEQFAVFDEAVALLNKSGFAVSEFGGRTVQIEAVPLLLSRKSPEKTLRKIIDDLSSLKKAGYDLKKAMAQSIACRAAVMSGDRLNDQEAVGLLEQLLRCQNKYSCPHGRPTFVRISRTDLDRQFGRA
jgi:DNA mismatch repair protein MutL